LTLVFFTDRDLGTLFPEILKGAGFTVERHGDLFPPDCPDEDWLAEVGKREWVALTHDARIRYKPRLFSKGHCRRSSRRSIGPRPSNSPRTPPRPAESSAGIRSRSSIDAEVRLPIRLHLTPEQEAKLRSVAAQLKLSPEALAETAVRDLLALPDHALLNVAQATPEDILKLASRVYEGLSQEDVAEIEGGTRDAALSRLRAGIDSMNFYSSGPLPSRDESHDPS